MSKTRRGKEQHRNQISDYSDDSEDSETTFVSVEETRSQAHRENSRQSSARRNGRNGDRRPRSQSEYPTGQVRASRQPTNTAPVIVSRQLRHVGVQMTTTYAVPEKPKPKLKTSCTQTDTIPAPEPLVIEKPVYIEKDPPPPKIVERIIRVRSPTPPPKVIVKKDPWPQYLYIPKKKKATKDSNRDAIYRRYLGQGIKPMRIIELDGLSKRHTQHFKIVDRYIRYAPEEDRKSYISSGLVPFRAYSERLFTIPDAPH